MFIDPVWRVVFGTIYVKTMERVKVLVNGLTVYSNMNSRKIYVFKYNTHQGTRYLYFAYKMHVFFLCFQIAPFHYL